MLEAWNIEVELCISVGVWDLGFLVYLAGMDWIRERIHRIFGRAFGALGLIFRCIISSPVRLCKV